MPNTTDTRTTTSPGDDLGSTDEVKIFKDEGDREDETVSSENLLEEKSSLIDLTEIADKCSDIQSKSASSPIFNKTESRTQDFNMTYLVPYSYSNSSATGLPVSVANKLGLRCFLSQTGEHFTSPPPAHCGIQPYHLDAKAMGITRTSIYPLPSSQYPYTILSPEITQVTAWRTPSVYSATNFQSTYHTSLSSEISNNLSLRFSSNVLPPVHTSPYHVIGPQTEVERVINNYNEKDVTTTSHNNMEYKNKKHQHIQKRPQDVPSDKKKPHIKKPLNAFMLYMKEMRAKVVAECTLKESAAINQILGRRWHELSREEQAKYYEKARHERQLHMELYPGWSARDNYGYVSKKKKRKRNNNSIESSKSIKKS
ncbi:protein pangolin, isoforms A/H/I/S [Musca domestica]|uniref:dTCF n=1 Tax=Musca domestica TaxID=7370 RepID=A0A1I8MJW6_MUSDO|nr:protein pangolin, isoforms A/H/I/S [Musca domestica]XP_058980892.1 protein pangolin, isoforms A/H/I/S [Musca domestica]XP_058980893.1 protein pangolin, isoforms A/H/I/S [Musca domestica]XP_058980894.1 protein pangolin, isoforms A/H/I/S [Musca domestica]XP_058980895.1 protein pangolin, isoforms A/H/I/S [Musca domestica]XP_058980896.1 protein pangolin, isoforms A/H/I/S [Musca domestica]